MYTVRGIVNDLLHEREPKVGDDRVRPGSTDRSNLDVRPKAQPIVPEVKPVEPPKVKKEAIDPASDTGVMPVNLEAGQDGWDPSKLTGKSKPPTEMDKWLQQGRDIEHNRKPGVGSPLVRGYEIDYDGGPRKPIDYKDVDRRLRVQPEGPPFRSPHGVIPHSDTCDCPSCNDTSKIHKTSTHSDTCDCPSCNSK